MAQTDYRIADIEGNELFNFNSATNGVAVEMTPDIEDMDFSLISDQDDYRAAGLNTVYYVGFNHRSFVIRGQLLHDSTNFNMWQLSSLPANKQVVKVYLASNWFVYALPQNPKFRRVQNQPSLWNYEIFFNCPDPFIYYAASDGAPGADYTIKPVNITSASNNIDIPLTQTNEGRSFTYIEPFFLLQGGASTSVTTSQTVSFRDQDGRKLTITPPVNWVNNVDLLVSPYFFRESTEGFRAQLIPVYQIVNGAINPATDWPLDIDPWDNSKFTHASNDLVRSFGVHKFDDVSASDLVPRHPYNYPRAIVGNAGGAAGNRIVVSSTGTLTDSTIDAIYLYRRL